MATGSEPKETTEALLPNPHQGEHEAIELQVAYHRILRVFRGREGHHG
ncbi:hypothetical protein PC120_g4495 [Phytophthora cactorum]|nr:hypothetical protein PC120_g4495 [Phytophthora cactorum]